MRTQSTQSQNSEPGVNERSQRLALRVRVMQGPSAGLEIPLQERPLLAGSSRSCDLRLADATVSRRHARFQVTGQRIRVEDLGSRNGTRFLGAAISQAEVPVGASIQLGRSLLSFLPAERVEECVQELGGLSSRSPKMKAVFELAARAAKSELPVLLLGETGVGKTLLARALHERSARAAGPFIALQCAELRSAADAPKLFGLARGKRTGAAGEEDSASLRAHEGTLFLEDVGELPLELQLPLVASLDAKGVLPDSGRPGPRSDFRLVTASRRDLQAEVAAGRLREELFYRLSGMVIRIPPLRERPEDIPLLVEQHLARLESQARLTPSTLAWMSTYPWPGNVRELHNAVERMAVLGTAEAIPEWGLADSDEQFHEARRAFEKSYLLSLLDKHEVLTDAAKASGLSRAHLYRLLAAHGLRRPSGS